MYKITKQFTFAAAHHLTSVPEGHQCQRVHGHNYVVTLELKAEELDSHGFVWDYGELGAFRTAVATYDHRDLNDYFKNPTAEVIARWLWTVAVTHYPRHASAVIVQETDGTSAEFRE